MIALQVKKEKQKEKVKIFEDKVKSKGYSLPNTLSPIQDGIPTTEKSIRLIVIIFFGLFLYQVFRDYQLLKAYAQDFPRSPLVTALILLPIIILPIATFSLWKNRKIGWTLLTIFLSFSIVGVLWSLYQSFSRKPSSFAELDNPFPRPSPVTYVVQLLFLGGTLYVLCIENIRDIFFISRIAMQATIAITVVFSFILTLAVS